MSTAKSAKMIDKDSILFKIFQRVDPGYLYIVIRFFKFILFLVDLFLDATFGMSIIHGSRWEREEAAADYEKSAQLVGVLGMGSWCVFSDHSLRNFLYYHKKYISPRYALEHDNITLLSITDKHAIFCISETMEDVLDTSIVPFMFITQFLEAKQLLIVPLDSFHRLANEASDPKEKVVIIAITARSGSTLLCQIFSKIPCTRVMSEPFGLCHVQGLLNTGRISLSEYRDLIKSCMRLQCKKVLAHRTDLTVLKLPVFCTPQCIHMKEFFPQMKFFFNARNLHPSILSLYKIHKNLHFWARILGKERSFYFNHMALAHDDAYAQRLHKALTPWQRYFTGTAEHFTIGTVICMRSYVKSRDVFDRLILYEDLMADYDKEVLGMLEAIGLPARHLERTKEALSIDSQGDVFMTGKYKGDIVSAEEWERVTEVVCEWGVPLSARCTVEEYRDFLNNGELGD